MRSRVLIVSPHPDDETLGAGGTILRYKNFGAEVHWLNFTDMATEYGYSQKEVEKRTREIKEVVNLYNFDGFINFRFKPAGLNEYKEKELVEKTAKIIRDIGPELIILPYENDIHSDHRIVFQTVYCCTKVFRYPSVKQIMSMEILSETDFACYSRGFIPNYFVDVSDFIEKKIQALKTYESEIQNHPFPRSEEGVKALATIRGIAAGCKYAEGFLLIKNIE